MKRTAWTGKLPPNQAFSAFLAEQRALFEERFVFTRPPITSLLFFTDSQRFSDERFNREERLPPADVADLGAWVRRLTQPLLEDLRYDRLTCAFCRQEYREADNLGTWQCSWHPERYRRNNECRYCNRTILQFGCHRCDHTPVAKPREARWHNENVFFPLPYTLDSDFPVNGKSPQFELRHTDGNPSADYVIRVRSEGAV
jgi:hypothetical protein